MGYALPLMVHRLKSFSAALSLAKFMSKVSSGVAALAPGFAKRA